MWLDQDISSRSLSQGEAFTSPTCFCFSSTDWRIRPRFSTRTSLTSSHYASCPMCSLVPSVPGYPHGIKCSSIDPWSSCADPHPLVARSWVSLVDSLCTARCATNCDALYKPIITNIKPLQVHACQIGPIFAHQRQQQVLFTHDPLMFDRYWHLLICTRPAALEKHSPNHQAINQSRSDSCPVSLFLTHLQ